MEMDKEESRALMKIDEEEQRARGKKERGRM